MPTVNKLLAFSGYPAEHSIRPRAAGSGASAAPPTIHGVEREANPSR
jgi:hypothetical protein